MALTGVAKKAGAAFSPKRRHRAKAANVAAEPERWTLGEVLRSREFAEKAHRAIVAQGYTEADLTRIIKEVRAELRGAKSPR